MHRTGVGPVLMALAVLMAAACDDDPGAVPPADSTTADAGVPDAPAETSAPDASVFEAGADATTDATFEASAPDSGGADARTSFVAVTFNTGTTEGLKHDDPPADGYTSAHAKLSDQYYGDGLAWTKAVAATTAFFAKLDPDIVVFQEIFHSADCATIPKTAHKDFVCETWKAGDPTVASTVLGLGWQVACHPGKPDKCAAVKKSFGTFRGCKTDFCLAGLDGYTVKDCGKGARVARGVIDLVGGGEITLVNVHGSSGVSKDDINCREKQFDQVFKDLGDGTPGASGKRNLVMGDLNTDPGRAALVDNSADRFTKYVGPGKKFHFISPVGFGAPPTYAGIFNIDHVVSDVFTGSCWSAGVTAGHPAVINAVYFDHKPLVCTIKIPQP